MATGIYMPLNQPFHLAVQPIHWIYNPEAMERAVAMCRDTPEFLPVSANAYYCIPTGSQSPYGDERLTTLESLVECKGILSLQLVFQGCGSSSFAESAVLLSQSSLSLGPPMNPGSTILCLCGCLHILLNWQIMHLSLLLSC